MPGGGSEGLTPCDWLTNPQAKRNSKPLTLPKEWANSSSDLISSEAIKDIGIYTADSCEASVVVPRHSGAFLQLWESTMPYDSHS